MSISLESLQGQLDAHQKKLGDINLRITSVEKTIGAVVQHLGLGNVLVDAGDNAPDTSAFDDRGGSARKLSYNRSSPPNPTAVQPAPPRQHASTPSALLRPPAAAPRIVPPAPTNPESSRLQQSVGGTAGAGPELRSVERRKPPPLTGQEAGAAADTLYGVGSSNCSGGRGGDSTAHDQTGLQEQHRDQDVLAQSPGPHQQRDPAGVCGQEQLVGGALASPCKSVWSARDDLSAYSAASTAMSLPATFRLPQRQPQPQHQPLPADDMGMATAAALWRGGRFGGAVLQPGAGQGRFGGGGSGSGGGWEDAFPEIASNAALAKVLAAAGSETQPWADLLAATSAGRRSPAVKMYDAGGFCGGVSTAAITTAAGVSNDVSSLGPGGSWPCVGTDVLYGEYGSGAVLAAGAVAAVVLMLQCRDDPEARLAVVRTPECLAAAAAMLRNGGSLERRIAAHLLWFVSRSREGARSLFDSLSSGAAVEPATGAAAALRSEPTLGSGCGAGAVAELGVVGGPVETLLAVMGGGDVHAAKAAALTLHNVLMVEGGAEVLERCCYYGGGGAASNCTTAVAAADGDVAGDASGKTFPDAADGGRGHGGAGVGGLVRALLDMLAGSDDIGSEAAAACLATAAECSERMRGQILAGGGAEALSALLLCGDPSTQASAAGALEQLSLEVEGATRLVACGAVRQVVELLRHGDEDARIRAVGVLRNLADVADCHHAMLRAGVLPELVAIIAAPPSGPRPEVQQPPQPPSLAPAALSPWSRMAEGGPLGSSRGAGGGVHPGGGGEVGVDANGSDEEGEEEAVSEWHAEEGAGGEVTEEEEEQEEEEEEVSANTEIRELAVDALVNMATRGGYDIRRTLAVDAGGGGTLGAAPSAADVALPGASGGSGGGGGLWALLLVASQAYTWDPATVAWALTGVLAITEDGGLRQALIQQGGVPVLQQVMLGGSPRQRELAAQALANVTSGASDATQEAIAEGGAPIVSSALVRCGNPGARHAACCVLQNLARCPAGREIVVAAGAAEALTEAAGDETDAKVAAAAVRALYQLSYSITACRQLVTRGSVGALVSAARRLSLNDMLESAGIEEGTLGAAAEGGRVAAWGSGPGNGDGSGCGVGGYISVGLVSGSFRQRGGAAGVAAPCGGVRAEKTARLLVKVLQRMLLYGDDKGAIRRQVEAALATTCLF